MTFFEEFKQRFKDAQNLFPGDLWIVLIVIVLVYALVTTAIAVRREKQLKHARESLIQEQEKSHTYQRALLKQEGEIRALEADSERNEYLKNLKNRANGE